MWKDKMLKQTWRLFVRLLYVGMIVPILLRLFPLADWAYVMVTAVQVSSSIAFLVFAWVYYNRPGWVKYNEV